MGLFDKLIKSFKESLTDDEKESLNQLGEALKASAEEKEREEKEREERPQAAAEESYEDERVPAEECQYNFKGTYLQYFDKVFNEEFPEYRVERVKAEDSRAYIYTFYEGARTALIVELLNSSSARKKLREDCRKNGTPYLRYYYDHEGWWNTRSYVTTRTRAALGK